MNAMRKISIVIPAFNEASVIGKIIKQAIAVMKENRYDYEVIVVDDGSQDETCEAATQAGAIVFRRPYNIGNGATVKFGIYKATGNVIVLMDGDGQHDPRDIPRLLEHLPPYEMVVGARTAESESEFHRDMANKLYNALSSYIIGRQVQDLTSGFRAIDATVAKKIAYLFPTGYSYPSTSTIALFRSGYTVKYIPIKASARVGKSKIKLLRDGIGFLLILLRIGVLFVPLKIFLPIAGIVFFPGFFYAIYRLFIDRAWTAPIIISVTAGLLIFVLGLISEQIALLRMPRSE